MKPFPASELPPGWVTLPHGSHVNLDLGLSIDSEDGQIAPIGCLSEEYANGRATYVSNWAEVEEYLRSR